MDLEFLMFFFRLDNFGLWIFCESWILNWESWILDLRFFVDLGLGILDISFWIFGFGISGPNRVAEFC